MKQQLSWLLVLLTAGIAAAQEAKPAVKIVCTTDKNSYSPESTVELGMSIQNEGSSDFYVYKSIDWGWTGWRFVLFDSSHHPVPLRHPLRTPPPPPPIYDKTQLVELGRGYFYGAHWKLDLSQFDIKPGKYFVGAAYRSYYKARDGFGLRILTWDDGEFRCDELQIEVRARVANEVN